MHEKLPDEPEVILEPARALANKLCFPESLHCYRTFLCRTRDAREVQSEMHQLQQIQIDFEAAKDTIQFVGEVCAEFVLDFHLLREDSGALLGLVTTGPARDAVSAAKQLLSQLEAALRSKMDPEDGDVWAQSACWAAANPAQSDGGGAGRPPLGTAVGGGQPGPGRRQPFRPPCTPPDETPVPWRRRWRTLRLELARVSWPSAKATVSAMAVVAISVFICASFLPAQN